MSAMLPAVPKAGTQISADDVAHIEQQIAASLSQIEDVETLEDWRLRAAALEKYLRGKEMQRPMLGAQRRVEARIGQLLGEPKPGKPNPHHDEVSHDQTRSDFRLLARGFECLTDPDEWRKSRRALVSYIRHKLGLLPETPPLPPGIYRCIVADPPWQHDTGPNTFGGTIESGHDNLEYEQMSLEDIKNLQVEKHAAGDAHLYLWTTNKYLEHSYDVARAWGFKPSVMLVWAKTPKGVGLGDAYRLTTEYVLYARRGNLKELNICETTWFNWPRGRHSQKPDEFYRLVENMTPARGAEDRLEMFARAGREGWTAWGEEAPHE